MKLIICIFTALMVSDVIAVVRIDLEHHRIRRSLRTANDHPPETLLGLAPDEHLKVTSQFTTPEGHTKVKMMETYKGLPVIGETVVLELDRNGKFTGEVQGRLVKGLKDDLPLTKPLFNPDEALQLAVQQAKDDMSVIKFNPDRDARLVIYVTGQGANLKAVLAYELSYRIETRQRISKPTFILNAQNGQIIKHWDAMSFASITRYGRMSVGDRDLPVATRRKVFGIGGNDKVGEYLYGYDLPKLEVLAWPNGTCQLENGDALVYNCNGSFDCEPSMMTPHQFHCEKGDVAQPVNGAYSPMNDVFFHIGTTAKMLRDWYNMSDPLMKGSEGNKQWKALVRYGYRWENAAWDGDQLLIGDGGEAVHPLTSLNMVAHEMAHGLTSVHSQLYNDGESGAISEAFSDMAGETSEYFLFGEVDWNVGYSDVKSPNKSFRYFKDPSKDGFSIGHLRDYCYGVDSHSSSGIFNKAFYNLATTEGWDIQKSFHAFLLANILYWGPETSFSEAACGVVSAAKDLKLKSTDVSNAFLAVGVVPCSDDGAATLPGPINIDANTTMNFKVNPYGLPVKELVFSLDQVYDLEMSVSAGTVKFDVRAPHGRLPDTFTVPTPGQCGEAAPCTISLTAFDDLAVTLLTLTPVQTIMDEQTLNTDEPSYYTFTMPQTLIDNKVQVMFQAEIGDPQGGLTFYIKHGQRPNGISHEYDAIGTLGGPAFLCRPQDGEYHLEVQGFHYEGSKTVSNVKVRMYALLGGKAEGH